MKKAQLFAFLLLTATRILAQTVATGDSRTVTEPSVPPICATVAATKYIVATNAVNMDPYNWTCGSISGTRGSIGCRGGTSYEPSSSPSSYVASETLDNTVVQDALDACPSGSAVLLVPGSGGKLGFVLAPFSLPSGVGLAGAAGIHVFASRDQSDYGGTNCGLVEPSGTTSNCNHWLTAPNTTGSGIYGPFVLDGRGWDSYIGSTTASFYVNRLLAYCGKHNGTTNGSPLCPNTNSGVNSYGPNALDLENADDFTVYKTTIKDSGNFIINWKGGDGFTGYGMKLLAPFEVSNTDGWDPLNSKNGTVTRSFISNGDNFMAVKAKGGSASNITVSFTQTGGGVGFTEGTDQAGGISNILVTDVVQRGNLNDSRSTGLMIASSTANGGLVNIVTYRRACIQNENNPLRFYTNYAGGSGSNTPTYRNIYLKDISILPSAAPFATGNCGQLTFQGLSGNPIQVWIDNLSAQCTNQGIAQQSGVANDQNANITIGPGAVPSSLLLQLSAGTNITISGTADTSTPYACSASMWQPLTGDMELQANGSYFLQSLSQAHSTPYTLQIVLEPTTDESIKEAAVPTQPVQILDNGTPIASVPFSGDGTYATYTVSNPTAGPHVYQARYPGDSNYPAYTFGNIKVNNGASPSPPTRLSGALVSLTGTSQ